MGRLSTTTTVYSDAADGELDSWGPYSEARAGSNLSVYQAHFGIVGQEGMEDAYIYELLLTFDTGTPIPDTDTIESATLSLYGEDDWSDTHFTIEARAHTWSAGGLTTADWVAGADLSGKTLLATFDTTGFSLTAYNILTSVAAFLDNINKTGNTDIVVCSKNQTDNVEPISEECVVAWTGEEEGTTYDPKLVVVHAPPAAGFTSLINTSSVA